ncbi:MAG: DNA/RNA helicase domain-containing protein [Thiohalorhabdus sp.]|uniref:DNA/RNA helicase domain-containing protein n=1 Tax=Thiohalorhabdus sp. TaxID=3094134 RepID=UPI00397EE1E4
MLIYAADKKQFLRDVRGNQIDERILDNMEMKGFSSVSPSEIASWRHSMQHMANVLEEGGISDDAGVAIEYLIPQTAKRVDFILTGQDSDSQETAVIVELKQWESVEATAKDAIVETFVGGAVREVPHPSYQAWTYKALLEDFNETVQEEAIRLWPCAYLHNCKSPDVVSPFYGEHLEQAPAFLKEDADKLARFLRQYVRKGDSTEILYRIEHGVIRPSKSLANHLASLLEGNQDFLMIDDQKLVFETALNLVEQAKEGEKQVLIVEGGPGTGKSVVAVNLLVELLQREYLAHYVTSNAAPRQVYKAKLTGSLTKTRIDNLFKGSGSFIGTDVDTFDALIVDEAHRLKERGTFQAQGENQVKEIINAAQTTVFFLDEDQKVHWKDIGSREEIEHWAEEAGAFVQYADLQSQFRCGGSDGYLAWLDNALQIRETANQDLGDLDYAVEVVDSPAELRDRIFELNVEVNRARLLAGYCWDWVSKKEPSEQDIQFPEYDFAMQWNLEHHEQAWMIQPDSVHQVGCIHTCQGLELDYAGVIIGPDLIVRDGKILTRPTERSKNDASIKGYKTARKHDREAADAKAEAIIKNTYRTLLSRGLKGCLIWCTDPETNEYFKALARNAQKILHHQPAEEADPALPFQVVADEDLEPWANAIPVVPLQAAAGEFSDLQEVQQRPEEFDWVEPPSFLSPSPGMFIAQVVGESMNRRIPNRAWCLFQPPTGGTREGKTVLVQHRDISDPDTGANFTLKRYRSEKSADPDTGWRHLRIILEPDSYDPSYEPIVLEEDAVADLAVIGELKAVLEGDD